MRTVVITLLTSCPPDHACMTSCAATTSSSAAAASLHRSWSDILGVFEVLLDTVKANNVPKVLVQVRTRFEDKVRLAEMRILQMSGKSSILVDASVNVPNPPPPPKRIARYGYVPSSSWSTGVVQAAVPVRQRAAVQPAAAAPRVLLLQQRRVRQDGPGAGELVQQVAWWAATFVGALCTAQTRYTSSRQTRQEHVSRASTSSTGY